MAQPQVSKQQALKEIVAGKKYPPLYSQVARNWFKQQGQQAPSHVVLYLNDSFTHLFVGLVAKPPLIVGFVLRLETVAKAPTDVRQYTMQKTKDHKTYIMADSTKFELAGYFKAPIKKAPAMVGGIRPSSREIYDSIASTEVVHEVTGIKFHVNVEVRKDKKDDEPVVAFYDSRHFAHENGVGQFVSAYYVSTIRNHSGGLNLDGGVPAWEISARNMRQIHDWLATDF